MLANAAAIQSAATGYRALFERGRESVATFYTDYSMRVPSSGYAENYHFDDVWYFNLTSGAWLEKETHVHARYVVPESGDAADCDVGSGSGRCSMAIAAAYPSAHLTLIDVDAERGERAMRALSSISRAEDQQCFIQTSVVPSDPAPLSDSAFDCIVALQAV